MTRSRSSAFGVRSSFLAALGLSVAVGAFAQEAPKPAENKPENTRDAAAAAAIVGVPRNYDASADFRIGPSDILDISVWKNPELSRTVPVRPDGKISLPLVNDIQASGFTTVQLRDQLTSRLAEFVPTPEVSVIVREVHSVKVSVMGAVKMPGNYEVNSPATVLDLIARAQGFTEFADRNKIVVLRQNGTETQRIKFNYGRVADSEEHNFFVKPGDVILVP